jgi:formate hydrogenlyase subunit 3/multisubunit Na+/H+ antiporter MnhD subunit
MKKLSALFIIFIAIIWFASGMASADTSHKDGEKHLFKFWYPHE